MSEQKTTGSAVPKQHFTLAGAAAAFAVRAHDGQRRIGTTFPYVVHPLGVGQILREFYPDRDDLEAAGYLHDVIEDTEYTYDNIKAGFGERVADLVIAVTRRRGWDLADYADDKDVMRLKAADVIDNVLDTIRGLEKGHDVWSRFSAGKLKVDYWTKITDMVDEALSDDPDDEPLIDRLVRVERKVWWMAHQ